MTRSPEAAARIAEELQERVRSIVADGVDVRHRVADAVARASRAVLASAASLESLVEATVAGGTQAVRAALTAEHADVLPQVVEGLGDGLAAVALAARMTLLEAGGSSRAFASAEVARAAEEFASLPDSFVQSLANGLARVSDHGAGTTNSILEHAQVTVRRIEPVLRNAAEAARSHPGQLARDLSRVGGAAVRGGAAAFFRALGQRLEALGVALDGSSGRGG